MSEVESNGQATEPSIEDRVKALEARLSDVEQRRREIEASAAEVDRLASSAEKKKAAYTAAKHAWEEAVEGHMELSRNWSKSEEVASRPLIAACERAADPVPADESWRDEPIDVLQAFGLSHGLRETLEEQGFHALGHLADWSRDHRGYTGIAGVGITKATLIENAFMAYWDARASDLQDADDAEDEAEDGEAPTGGGCTSLPEAEAAYSAELKAWATHVEDRTGLDLVTSRPDSTPESNGVEEPAKPRRRRKAKA